MSILKNINLKIYKGESVAILGSNGSGKSTFLNLLTGLVEPSDGQILIDGSIDIMKIKKSWIKNLSYVQQNIFLLNDLTISLEIKLTVTPLSFGPILNNDTSCFEFL